mmetsp:Transcript_77376/g.149451  ORF Transcript_77376/g.149451 Transcript_77376/m.149451 type:complete len:94 (-) Transcript_77376:2-283(-)
MRIAFYAGALVILILSAHSERHVSESTEWKSELQPQITSEKQKVCWCKTDKGCACAGTLPGCQGCLSTCENGWLNSGEYVNDCEEINGCKICT